MMIIQQQLQQMNGDGTKRTLATELLLRFISCNQTGRPLLSVSPSRLSLSLVGWERAPSHASYLSSDHFRWHGTFQSQS